MDRTSSCWHMSEWITNNIPDFQRIMSVKVLIRIERSTTKRH